MARSEAAQHGLALPEASQQPKQAFDGHTDGQAGDYIARPMSEKGNAREHQPTSDCPNGIPLGWRQHGSRRCQGSDMDG